MSNAMVGFLVVGALLSVIGEGIKRMVFRDPHKAAAKGWRGWYYLSMWAHPILAGSGLGAAGLPSPEGFPSLLWYAGAGAFSGTCYAAVEAAIKRSKALDVVPARPPSPPPAVDNNGQPTGSRAGD